MPSSTMTAVRPDRSMRSRPLRSRATRSSSSARSRLSTARRSASVIRARAITLASSTWAPPSPIAPMASSGWNGTPSLRTTMTSSGAPSAPATSNATGTPPRGRPRTTTSWSCRYSSRAASSRPASTRSANTIIAVSSTSVERPPSWCSYVVIPRSSHKGPRGQCQRSLHRGWDSSTRSGPWSPRMAGPLTSARMNDMTYVAAEDRYESMTYRRVGRSGVKLPLISLGLWHNFGDDRSLDTQRAILRRAFDLGVCHIDLANNYGPPYGSAEANFGTILRQDLLPYRDELFLSTKAGWDMWPGPYGEFGSRKYLLASLDQSLTRMGVDYVDVFYSHRPDPETPLEETMGALDTAVRSGKALYAGISSYSPERTAEAASILAELGTPLFIHQPSYSCLLYTSPSP